MGARYIVTFSIGLALIAGLTIYGVLTEDRRGSQRLDQFGRVVKVIRSGDGKKQSWVIVDEIEAGGDDARQQGLQVIKAWVAAQGADPDLLRDEDIRVEEAFPGDERVLRFLVREEVLGPDWVRATRWYHRRGRSHPI